MLQPMAQEEREGEGRGVRTGDWTHSCGKRIWPGGPQPTLIAPSRCGYRTSLGMCVCVCVATSRRANEIQNAKYVGEVSHA